MAYSKNRKRLQTNKARNRKYLSKRENNTSRRSKANTRRNTRRKANTRRKRTYKRNSRRNKKTSYKNNQYMPKLNAYNLKGGSSTAIDLFKEPTEYHATSRLGSGVPNSHTIGYITINLDTKQITLKNNNKNYTIPFSLVNNTITVNSIYFTEISPPKLKLNSNIKVQISDLNDLIQYVNFVMICCTLENPDINVFDLTEEKFYREYEEQPGVDPFDKLYKCDGIFIRIIKNTELISLPNSAVDINDYNLNLKLPDPTTIHEHGMKQKHYSLILQSLSRYNVFTINITTTDSDNTTEKSLSIDITSNKPNQDVTLSLSYTHTNEQFIYTKTEVEATVSSVAPKKRALFGKKSKAETKTTKFKKGASLSSILYFLDYYSNFNVNIHDYFLLYIDTNPILFNNLPENRAQDLNNFSTDTKIYSSSILFDIEALPGEQSEVEEVIKPITPQFNSFFKINHNRLR